MLTYIAPTTVVGATSEAKIRSGGGYEPDPSSVSIGADTIILDRVVIGHDSAIGDSCFIDAGCVIGYGARVGDETRIMHQATICDRVAIGTCCRIAGLVSDGAIISDNCHSFGHLLHKNSRPHTNFWEHDEEAPRLMEFSVVSHGAVVIGPCCIGRHSYVASGAVVTKDVPEKHVCIGINEHIPFDRWKGSGLQEFIKTSTIR